MWKTRIEWNSNLPNSLVKIITNSIHNNDNNNKKNFYCHYWTLNKKNGTFIPNELLKNGFLVWIAKSAGWEL